MYGTTIHSPFKLEIDVQKEQGVYVAGWVLKNHNGKILDTDGDLYGKSHRKKETIWADCITQAVQWMPRYVQHCQIRTRYPDALVVWNKRSGEEALLRDSFEYLTYVTDITIDTVRQTQSMAETVSV